MIKLISFLTIVLTFIEANTINAQQTGQDSTGLPGDNFSLQGAIELFKSAASPEAYEQALNAQENHVNNLDLDGDGEIDYVRVIDHVDGDAHALILQVAVSEKENQDVAVIEVEKDGDASAMLQIVGDEELYGDEVIVEPNGEMEEVGVKKGKGPAVDELVINYVVVNVWGWPSVRFIYAPAYRPYVSPWRWHHYPAAWRPWRPVAWRVWHPFHTNWHRHYVIVPTHRVVRAHRIYTPHRSTSVIVHTRHSPAVGRYHVNTHKATVTGPRGHKTTVKKTTVRGPAGHVRGTKTTVKRRH